MPIVARVVDRGPLTPREAQVLGLICEGQPIKAIARRLGVSPKTVSTHVGHIQDKFLANSMLQAALIAIADGLVKVSRTLCLLLCLHLGAQLEDGGALRHRAPRHRGEPARVSLRYARGTGRPA